LSFQLVSELDPLHFDFIIKWATIMVSAGEGYSNQGRSTIRPPLFRGANFSH